ncbi:hypothetical protein [Streptococcus marmotae]|uniref:hypothetical protein n=1 Tax=Streptococcus marmotae TaxID=1825069 RepID=UPI000A851E6A|nr:hypothetical protein [Streptococcus marmotae]
MQYIELNLPDHKYKDYVQKLLSLDMSDKNVNLLYDLKFMPPFVGLLVSSFLNEYGFKVTHEVGNVGKDSVHYAKNNIFSLCRK